MEFKKVKTELVFTEPGDIYRVMPEGEPEIELKDGEGNNTAEKVTEPLDVLGWHIGFVIFKNLEIGVVYAGEYYDFDSYGNPDDWYAILEPAESTEDAEQQCQDIANEIGDLVASQGGLTVDDICGILGLAGDDYSCLYNDY